MKVIVECYDCDNDIDVEKELPYCRSCFTKKEDEIENLEEKIEDLEDKIKELEDELENKS
jgi:predicted  nucleic acid-binding Zn-ribbon protein